MFEKSGATWEKPELIVLARSRPEEVLLAGCKISGTDGPDNINKCTTAGGQGQGNWCTNQGTS